MQRQSHAHGERDRRTTSMLPRVLLTVADLARELRCCVRTARRWCASWMHLAGHYRVPRVILARTGRRGHPKYLVDLATLRAWLRAAFTPANNNACA